MGDSADYEPTQTWPKVDELRKSVQLNIEKARARLLESYGEEEIERACRDRIEGLQASFPRKIEELESLAQRCGVTKTEIVVFESLTPRRPPSECTGFVSAGTASKGGLTINAKVRELNAAYIQGLVCVPRRTFRATPKRHSPFPANSVSQTHSFFGCRTLGTWGIAMGMNEYGVSIGDHTSFAKDPLHPFEGLESNDVCRLVMETARTAEEGERLARELVEGHGHAREGQIYMIADSKEGWVVEATSERCVSLRVTDSVGARANQYKIGSSWDRASDDLISYARKAGLWDGKGRFNFAAAYSKAFPWAYDRRFRYKRVMQLLATRIDEARLKRARNGVVSCSRGRIALEDGFAILSDHAAQIRGEGSSAVFDPGPVTRFDVERNPALKSVRQICSHFRFPSVAAQVAVHDPSLLAGNGGAAWICLGNPCLSLFLPIPAGAAAIPAAFCDGSMWRRFTQIEGASRKRYKRVKAIGTRIFRETQRGLVRDYERAGEEAHGIMVEGKPEVARRLMSRQTSSAFKRVAAALDTVLSQIKEAGFQ
jgi:dipeptidase